MSNPSLAAYAETRHRHTGIDFHSPAAFWIGTALVTVGVLLHLPDYASAAPMGFNMKGMPMTWWMMSGMFAILVGFALAAWGLFPRKEILNVRDVNRLKGAHFRAMDSAHLTRSHWGLLFVLGVALIIDVMKPATLGFILPGTRQEYGISTGMVALLPLSGLTGTTIGSLVWGVLADRIGRRAAILLASIMFIGTSICGFMPSFRWNLFMCFVMGLSAGGMLPIVYALMAESVPAAKRGWLVVLHGGMGIVGGYLAAAGAAALLEPVFAWRILWFVGLPTGLLMLLLNRWIPESPRFLLERGRVREARAVMARYGVVLETDEGVTAPVVPGIPIAPAQPAVASRPAPAPKRISPGLRLKKGDFGGLKALFAAKYRMQTFAVILYGVGWGLVNWGFLTFLPTFLSDAGFARNSASELLFFSALLAVPGTVLVAYLYGTWSSKRSMVLYALATVVTMSGFVFLNPTDPAASNQVVLMALVVALLISSGGVIAMLSPYTAEVYPTHLRGSGSGLAAGSSKVGGIFGPPMIAGVMAISSGVALPAIVAAIPMALSAAVLAMVGLETRGRSLEDISAAAEDISAAAEAG